jgi:hypothetical protein
MPNFKKKAWTQPRIRQFTDASEVWDYSKSRGSPEELARLRALLTVRRYTVDPA